MNMTKKKVVVAMSGGVDSSVAAGLLKEQGYEVIGVTMNLFSLPKEFCTDENLRSCCGRGAVEDAHRVALSLEIPHYVADFREQFERKVIADFCEEYARGRTPNPCIRCNEHIKFEVLMEKAKAFEANQVATGHHARIEKDLKTGRYLLKKGKDREKDQSYFLYPFTQDQLSRTLLPIGNLTKKEVRKKAQKLGLPVAKRSESQEICFIPDNDYAGFIKNRIPEAFRPGPIVDIEDHVLGQHDGIVHFTVGQRKGMGIAARDPLYVLAIQGDKNKIVVGSNDQLYKKTLQASRVNLISLSKITKSLTVKAKIRYKHREAKAVLTPLDGDQVRVEFERNQRAITPGQAVVFYDGDVVVGGGIIDKVNP